MGNEAEGDQTACTGLELCRCPHNSLVPCSCGYTAEHASYKNGILVSLCILAMRTETDTDDVCVIDVCVHVPVSSKGSQQSKPDQPNFPSRGISNYLLHVMQACLLQDEGVCASEGVSQEAIDLADDVAIIPMQGCMV